MSYKLATVNGNDLWSLALTAYAESKSLQNVEEESTKEVRALVWIPINRATLCRRWKGLHISTICQEPGEFACWIPDTNLNYYRSNVTLLHTGFREAISIAAFILSGLSHDITNGATHYHDETDDPQWARSRVPCHRVGRKLFYSGVEK